MIGRYFLVQTSRGGEKQLLSGFGSAGQAHARVGARAPAQAKEIGPVVEAENELKPSLKMTPKEQFIEAANMMCGYTRGDLAMLSEKELIQVIDGFLVLAEEPEKRGNPGICRWAKRLRELRVKLMEGSQ